MSLPTKFSTAIDAELLKSKITEAEFIRLEVPGAVDSPFLFSSSFKNELDLANNKPWTSLGGLVSVSGHQRDLSVTSFDTIVTLVGIDQSRIGLVLEVGKNPDNSTHGGLKGSKIQIYRGFYDDNYNLIDTPQLRYTGIITSYTITEDRIDRTDTFTLALHASSFKTVLENRTAGRFTNSASWSKFNSDDTSMDRVAGINNVRWPFGVKLA